MKNETIINHFNNRFVHDREVAAQTVAGVIEMLVVGNRRGDGIQRDGQHHCADQQYPQRPGGASRRVRRRVQQASLVGQSPEELRHGTRGPPQRKGTPTLRGSRRELNQMAMMTARRGVSSLGRRIGGPGARKIHLSNRERSRLNARTRSRRIGRSCCLCRRRCWSESRR